MNKQLEVRNITVAYGDKVVADGVSFFLKEGDIGCLLGPSGCGKTSLLRAIAGFEPVTGGEVHLHQRCVSRPGFNVAPEKRQVGMVFQDFALYPHLTVEKNVAFGLRSLSGKERGRRVTELLQLVGLEAARKQFPHQLSGGQQQRIALIRAMAPRPQVLLLDEPFSGLDVELREQLAAEVREILKRDRITAILVTHDQLEAFAMADVIGVMSGGQLRQWDTGYQLYHQPADRFVADFIGQGVLIPGTAIDGHRVNTALGVVAGDTGQPLLPGTTVDLLLRPDDLIHDDDSKLKLEVLDKAFRGAEFIYTLKSPDGTEVLCLVQSHHDHRVGDSIGVYLETGHLVAFPTGGQSTCET